MSRDAGLTSVGARAESVATLAERFRALGEPARLRILHTLRDGEMSVNGVVRATGLGQANASKHPHVLHSLGFVSRRRDGPFAYYAFTDGAALGLCGIVCGLAENQPRGATRSASMATVRASAP